MVMAVQTWCSAGKVTVYCFVVDERVSDFGSQSAGDLWRKYPAGRPKTQSASEPNAKSESKSKPESHSEPQSESYSKP